jgi:hypothetical protein
MCGYLPLRRSFGRCGKVMVAKQPIVWSWLQNNRLFDLIKVKQHRRAIHFLEVSGA